MDAAPQTPFLDKPDYLFSDKNCDWDDHDDNCR